MSLPYEITKETVSTALNPYKWIAYLVLVAALVGGYFWHRSQLIEQGKEAGKAEVQALWNKAKEDAKEAQSKDNTSATADAVKVVTEYKTVYRDRIKKVVEYVPSESSGPCLADDDFVRLFNGEDASGVPKAGGK